MGTSVRVPEYGRLEVYAVSPRVNNVRHQDADLTEPVTALA
jgi:putative SOS response-associated peptidase YedK